MRGVVSNLEAGSRGSGHKAKRGLLHRRRYIDHIYFSLGREAMLRSARLLLVVAFAVGEVRARPRRVQQGRQQELLEPPVEGYSSIAYRPSRGSTDCSSFGPFVDESQDFGTRLPPCRNFGETAPEFGGSGIATVVGPGNPEVQEPSGSGVDFPTFFPGSVDADSSTISESPFGDTFRPFVGDPFFEPNEVQVTLYIGLEPLRPSVGFVVGRATTDYLNKTLDDYTFQVGRRKLEGETFWVEYKRATSRIIERLPDLWWWQYNVSYTCFWANTREPIVDAETLDTMSTQMNDSMWQAVNEGDDLELLMRDVVDDGAMFITMEPPFGSPDRDASATKIFSRLSSPVDVGAWPWWRYVGLGIFSVTIAVTLLVSQIAGHRYRQRMRKDLWGNLGTEKGVEELLTMGWRLRGSKDEVLEIYDKEKWGYRDDDSMLIGGFEQKEVVGAEVTVTHPSSVATPDTRLDGMSGGLSQASGPPC